MKASTYKVASQDALTAIARHVHSRARRLGGRWAVFVFYRSVECCESDGERWKALKRDPAFENCLAGVFDVSSQEDEILSAMITTWQHIEALAPECERTAAAYRNRLKATKP